MTRQLRSQLAAIASYGPEGTSLGTLGDDFASKCGRISFGWLGELERDKCITYSRGFRVAITDKGQRVLSRWGG